MRLSFFVITASWAVLVLVVAALSLPTTVMTPRWVEGQRTVATTLMPQGWAFFTKSSRGEAFRALPVDEDETLVEPDIRNGSLANGFGLNRSFRLVNSDLEVLRRAVPKEAWNQCAENDEGCWNAAKENPLVVDENGLGYIQCGDYYLVSVEPIPYSWRERYESKQIVRSVVRLEVTC